MRFLTISVISIVSVILIFLLADLIFEKIYSNPQITYGVSFSPNYAKYLGLDWQKVYLQMLDDLKVRNLRLPTFWDTIEKDPQKDDFTEVDFMVTEASKKGTKIILVLGIKQPRWPECHVPAWAKKLSVRERQAKALEFMQKVVERYKANEAIYAWQVENEPYVAWFGENCDPPDEKFLQQEVQLVKSLDKRSIIITDSGEWSSWKDAMKLSDALGVSLYRKSHSPIFGYYSYPIPVWSYPLKSNIIRKKTIIVELQAEPWTKNAIPDTLLEEQIKLFGLKDFQNNVRFAQKTGFDEIYLWGVEWWYFMAQKGYPQYLEYAKTLFR